MAQSTSVAGAVVGVADIVGLAGIPARDSSLGTEPIPGPAASEPLVGRDADGLGIRGEGSSRVGVGGEVEPERARTQPAVGLGRDALPFGNRFGFRFWRKANRITHRGRLWARASGLVMLSSIT